MRKITRISVHTIIHRDQFDFSPTDYSMFKFGSNKKARQFGYDLAEKFIKNIKENNEINKPYIILPSAYSHVPPASFFLKNHFVDKLNDFLIENKFSPVEERKIHRTVTYRDDYGEMTAEKRYNLIKGDIFYLDKTNLNDKTLLFIDDIRITGTHEKIMIKLIDDYKIDNDLCFLYFCILENNKIDPNIENYLNYYYIKKLNDLNYIIQNEDFIFNTRVIKYILSKNKNEFYSFIYNKNDIFIINLYYKAIGNSYHLFDQYNDNLLYLKELIKK